MKERLDKLLTVESIVTIVFTIVFSILSLRSVITPDQFITLFTVIIGFYFGRKSMREENKKEKESEK